MNRVGGVVNTALERAGVSAVITGRSDPKLTYINNRISSSYKDRNRFAAFNLIDGFRSKGAVCLPKPLRDQAKYLFNMVEDDPYFKGKRLNVKVASVLFIVTRKSKLPKSVKDLTSKFDITKKELLKFSGEIAKRICPKVKLALQPSECIPQILVRLNLKGLIEQKSKAVAEYITSNEMLTGKNPYTLAGVAIYIATKLTGEEKSLKDIAEAVELAESTIKNAYKELYKHRFEILKGIAESEDQIKKCLPEP